MKPGGGAPRGRRRLLVWGAQILLVVLVVYAVHLWKTRDAPSGPAPALDGELLGGGRFALEQARGEPLLVYFWAVWCPVCGLQEGAITSLAEDYPVVTVATQSGPADAVRRHLRSESLQFPVLVDPDGSLAARWGVRGVPTSFVIGPEGRARSVSTGYRPAAGLRFRLWLAR